MSQNTSSPNPTASEEGLTPKELDAQIWERQNFILGCEEMERITQDVLIHVFSDLAAIVESFGYAPELTLMDCESPLDHQLYDVGLRITFTYESAIQIAIVADPSDWTYTLTVEGFEEPISLSYKFHEVIPKTIQRAFRDLFREHLPKIKYALRLNRNDITFDKFKAPFRVQYDDNGTISDVATTKTLIEAANMGSTFAKMFKKEDAITVIDAEDNILC